MIPCRAMLDVSAELLRYLSGLLVGECRRRATPARSRKLNCREQATLARRWFRNRTPVETLRPRPWDVPRDRLPVRLRVGVSARQLRGGTARDAVPAVNQ